MAMGLRIEETGGSLEAYLNNTLQVTEDAKNKLLKKSAAKTKAAVIRYIPRSIKPKKGRSVRMADDVQAGVVEDRIYGGKMVRVRGGKKTGTLWHIVNDGTSRNKASHFMDKALAEVESELDGMIDAAMNGV
jgi:HK97 gp10 family phage protein